MYKKEDIEIIKDIIDHRKEIKEKLKISFEKIAANKDRKTIKAYLNTYDITDRFIEGWVSDKRIYKNSLYGAWGDMSKESVDNIFTTINNIDAKIQSDCIYVIDELKSHGDPSIYIFRLDNMINITDDAQLLMIYHKVCYMLVLNYICEDPLDENIIRVVNLSGVIYDKLWNMVMKKSK